MGGHVGIPDPATTAFYGFLVQLASSVLSMLVIGTGVMWWVKFLARDMKRLSAALEGLTKELALLRDDHGQRIASIEGRLRDERTRR